jgi:hypothetical protein
MYIFYYTPVRHEDVCNTSNAFEAYTASYSSPNQEASKEESIDWKRLFDDSDNENLMDGVNLFDSDVAVHINPYRSTTDLPITTLNLNEGIIGSKHPDQNVMAQKARWTDKEVDTVGEWCLATLHTKPEWGPCIISKCLSYIMKSKAIRELFLYKL